MNIRLLVVEDDPQIGKYIETILSGHEDSVSFECNVVSTVSECEQELAKLLSPYDEVLLDLNLPNGRGIATFLRVYIYTRRLRIPLVVMTADQFIHDAEVVRNGAQDFIMKPLPAAEVIVEKLHYAVLRYESVKETADKYQSMLTGIRSMIDKLDELKTEEPPPHEQST